MPEKQVPLSDHIETFLEMMSAERGASPNTTEAYRRDLAQACEYFGTKQPEAIDTAEIRDFISSISNRYAGASVSRKISAIKQFFAFLKSERYINSDPARLIELPKKSRTLPNFLTPEEIEALKAAAEAEGDSQGLRMLAFINIFAGSGLRVSEIITLRKGNIQTTESEGRTYHFLMVRGKGEKERITPLTQNAVSAIHNYMEVWEEFLTIPQKVKLRTGHQDFWLFPSRGRAGHITRQQVANLLKKYADLAGLDRSRISPHVLRHSFATNILEKGMDLRVLQEILGHSDISTTQIYTHINSSKMKDFVEKNHPLARRRT